MNADDRVEPPSLTEAVADLSWILDQVEFEEGEFLALTGVGKEFFTNLVALVRERALEAGLIVVE